ncbi:UNVERIFIED_CONTAM: Retrovirus-related Pol polyprotein from transposon RE1 [Sesamum indicum]
MESEIKALEDNDTWNITELPKGKKAIGSKWIYKLKLRPDGSLDRYKARLVAKGYNQIEGIDYDDRFSPVAKAVTIRTFLAVICKQHWFLHQLDINNAFLHGFIEEEIYMKPPEGYDVPAGHVCKLKRSLYGIKQASRQWNLEFTKQLERIGFTQSKADHCLFTIHTDVGFFCLLIYVDDVLIAGPCEHTIADFKNKLHNLFTIKNLGKARFFLGLEMGRSTEGMIITQGKYVRDIVADAGLAQCLHSAKLRTLPYQLVYNLRLLQDNSSATLNHVEDWATCKETRKSLTEAEYRSMVSTTCELIWIHSLLKDLKVDVQTPIPFYCDNQAALYITANPVFHERTKHIEIDCHLVRDKYKEGFIAPKHIASKEQPADVFTKILTGARFMYLLSKLNLVNVLTSLT